MSEPTSVVLNHVFVAGYSRYTVKPFTNPPTVIIKYEKGEEK